MPIPKTFDRERERVQFALRALIAEMAAPPPLKEAMAYSLLLGGKRLRPVLLLVTHGLFESNGPDPIPAACAIEMIHTYSLIHDDLPAMDNDDFRRGQPSCHKRFGEALAILAGDALLTEAFALIARAYRESGSLGVRVLAEVAMAAGADGMVGGQVLDTVETGWALDWADVERIHRKKTGALIRASVRCGALLGAARDEDLEALSRFADGVGLAFQVADDLLDATSTREQLGKTPGKDAAQQKNSAVACLGVDGARNLMRKLFLDAIAHLDRFGPRAEDLRSLARWVIERAS